MPLCHVFIFFSPKYLIKTVSYYDKEVRIFGKHAVISASMKKKHRNRSQKISVKLKLPYSLLGLVCIKYGCSHHDDIFGHRIFKLKHAAMLTFRYIIRCCELFGWRVER